MRIDKQSVIYLLKSVFILFIYFFHYIKAEAKNKTQFCAALNKYQIQFNQHTNCLPMTANLHLVVTLSPHLPIPLPTRLNPLKLPPVPPRCLEWSAQIKMQIVRFTQPNRLQSMTDSPIYTTHIHIYMYIVYIHIGLYTCAESHCESVCVCV